MSSSDFSALQKRIEQLRRMREGGHNPWDLINRSDPFDMQCIEALYIQLNAPQLDDNQRFVDAESNSLDSDSDSDFSWKDFNQEVRSMRESAEGGESEIESGTESDSY
jgi:hypothetical protein